MFPSSPFELTTADWILVICDYFSTLNIQLAFLNINGAHERNRTVEPLPYQGSALPTELRGHLNNARVGHLLERETRFELATSSLEG
jgi:hypothetical protein